MTPIGVGTMRRTTRMTGAAANCSGNCGAQLCSIADRDPERRPPQIAMLYRELIRMPPIPLRLLQQLALPPVRHVRRHQGFEQATVVGHAQVEQLMCHHKILKPSILVRQV